MSAELFGSILERLAEMDAKLDRLLEKKKPKPRKAQTNNPKFNLFWDAYPLKKGKKAALAVFCRIGSAIDMTTLVRDVMHRTKNDRQWLAGYIPHASTYLNGELWNDEIQSIPSQAATLPKINEDLEPWAIKNGHRGPLVGESWSEYRNYLQGVL